MVDSYIAISIDAALPTTNPRDQAWQWGATLPSLSRDFPYRALGELAESRALPKRHKRHDQPKPIMAQVAILAGHAQMADGTCGRSLSLVTLLDPG